MTAVAVIMGLLSSGGVQAQSFRTQPAEFPPASYKGKQFVDSAGCVFIRAGIDGNVTWVPRVSRKRQGVCGFKPTGIGSGVASAGSSAKAPVKITMNNGAAAPAAPAPVKRAPAPVAVATVAARPMPKVRTAPTVAPKVVRQTAPKPVPAPPVRPVAVAPVAQNVIASAPPSAVRPTSGGCIGRTPLSQRYSGSGSTGLPVRCGPQAAPVVGSSLRSAAVTPRVAQAAPLANPAPQGANSKTRIVPKHVAEKRYNTYANVSVPEGYKSVWEDDRLNPQRAEQDLSGRLHMFLIWTNTVPRRLVNRATGQDMTARMPLVYPYTSVAQQTRELGQVTFAKRNGQLVKRIVRNRATASVARPPVYSSRSSRKMAVPAVKPLGSTYVQVGMFANMANAQKTAQRIAAMGMGARIGKSIRSGKPLMSVQAGPFGAQAAPNALGKLRGVGFRDAYIR